jgi:hypothetical protein
VPARCGRRGCEFLIRLGACPSEAGAAGTTPAQVKQSFIGAVVILGGAIPFGDILGALGLFGGGADAGAAAAAAEDTAPSLLRAGGSGARLPMNMDTVNSVADKYGIDISDNDISINKTVAGIRGSTAPDQSITLYRGAFENEEQLAQTLVHEQYHVGQLQAGMPYPDTYQAGSSWEEEAENFANDWWYSLDE